MKTATPNTMISLPATKWREKNLEVKKLKAELAKAKTAPKRKQQTAVVTFKVDAFVKQRAQQVAEASGLSLTDVLNLSLRHYIDRESIEAFPIYQMSEQLEKDLAEIEEDIKHGRNIVATVRTEKELRDFFDAIERGEYAD